MAKPRRAKDESTLAEWLADPTVTKEDRFAPMDAAATLDQRVAFTNGYGHFVLRTDGEDGDELPIPVPLVEYQRPWRRLPVDLSRLTAKQALERGLVHTARKPRKCRRCGQIGHDSRNHGD